MLSPTILSSASRRIVPRLQHLRVSPSRQNHVKPNRLCLSVLDPPLSRRTLRSGFLHGGTPGLLRVLSARFCFLISSLYVGWLFLPVRLFSSILSFGRNVRISLPSIRTASRLLAHTASGTVNHVCGRAARCATYLACPPHPFPLQAWYSRECRTVPVKCCSCR